MVLAIFYDKTVKSHAIESPVFEFNLKNDEIKLIQTIPTDGAKIINIFIIDNVGVYLLLGCVKGKSESLLLRFDFKTGKVTVVKCSNNLYQSSKLNNFFTAFYLL